MVDDKTARMSAPLHQAAETHHQVFAISDGEDPDLASWYADWVVNLSPLAELLGSKTCAQRAYVHARRARQGIRSDAAERALGAFLRGSIDPAAFDWLTGLIAYNALVAQ